MDRLRDGFGQFQIVASASSVGVHAGKENFPGSQSLGLAHPLDGIALGGLATAVSVNYPLPSPIALGIHRHHHSLGTKCLGSLRNQARALKC
jgi:hypothetical protein